jgi:chemotaxis protein histidine kinase CheA
MSDYLDPENSSLLAGGVAEARAQAASLASHAAAMRDPLRLMEALDEVYRCAHSLRAEAGAAGMEELSRLAGLMRDTAEALRSAGPDAAQDVGALMREAADTACRLAEGIALDTTALAGLLAEARDGAGKKRPARAKARTVRVDSSWIDAASSAATEVKRIASALVASAQKAAGGTEQELQRAARELHEAAFSCTRAAGELRDAIARIRLVPLVGVFRSVARKLGRGVELVTEGGRTEIDVGMTGDLAELLSRYALLRGGDRKRGRASGVRFALTARPEADCVVVALSGGRGTKPAAERDLRKEAGERLARVGGRMEHAKGIEVRLPRVPGVSRCLLARVGAIVAAVPSGDVVECLSLRGNTIARDGKKIPMVRLEGLFAPTAPQPRALPRSVSAAAGRRESAVVVVKSGTRLAGLIADAHIGVEEVTSELPAAAPSAAERSQLVARAGVREDGTPVRVLDVHGLVARAYGKKPR